MFHGYAGIWDNGSPRFYNHGNSTIAEAGFARLAGINMWTVALSAGEQGDAVLKQVANPDQAYTSDPTGLSDVFAKIAGSIASAVKDAQAVDPMGAGFEIPAPNVGKIKIESVPSDPAPRYDTGTPTITWNPGTLATPIEPGSDIRYAEIKYRVTINDKILDAHPNKNGEYLTNGDAQLNYTDSNGKPQSVSFPKPTVKPTLYVIEKKLYDESGNQVQTNKKFSAEVSATNYKRNYELNAAQGKGRVMTDLRLTTDYSVKEIGDLSNYSVTYETFQNGQSTTGQETSEPPTFKATDNGQKFTVVIHNRPAVGALAITKVLNDKTSAEKATNATYTGTYQCTKGSTVTAKGTWNITGAGNATLTPEANTPEPTKIPVNSNCTVNENKLESSHEISTDFYTWADPVYSDQPVTIAKDKTSTVTVTNALTENLGSLTWKKVDGNDLLGGSEWELTGPGGTVQKIHDCISESSVCAGPDKDPEAGKFKLEGVKWGKYTLVETLAPAGYIVDTTVRTVSIGDEAKTLQGNFGEIQNTKVVAPTIPLTGGISRDAYIIVGLATVALGLAMTGAYAVRRKAHN